LSTPVLTKAEFQDLAEARLVEAKALLDRGMWDGAYYLAGYAVELALKACIIKMLMATDAFPDRKFSEHCYTHRVEDLIRVAKLDGPWNTALAADRDLFANWAVVKDWSEQKRYHRIDKAEAEALYTAITDGTHGVLPWIKTQW
jgi:HEPN domain-containing protein